jgi:hypothetical protein
MKILLKDKRIFQYNDAKSASNGIHITLANKIDSINEPKKLLFSQGNFRIIEN